MHSIVTQAVVGGSWIVDRGGWPMPFDCGTLPTGSVPGENEILLFQLMAWAQPPPLIHQILKIETIQHTSPVLA
jgi:hypothetical protein